MAGNIKPDEIYRTAEAERGKFWVVDDDYLSTLGYPASGKGKYCILTYQVNPSPLELSGGNISLGQVSIKDGNSPITMDVVNVGALNTIPVIVLDGTGAQITNFDGNLIDRTGPTLTLNNVSVSGNGTPIPVAGYHNYTVHITSTNVTSTSGAVVEVQSSIDGSAWATIATIDIKTNKTNEVAITNGAYVYLRASITSYLDGNFTSKIYAGN